MLLSTFWGHMPVLTLTVTPLLSSALGGLPQPAGQGLKMGRLLAPTKSISQTQGAKSIH